MKKQQRQWKFPVKSTVILIILFLVLYSALVYLDRTISNLPYFKIKDIIVNQGDAAEFYYLKGHNIFKLDLKKEARYIAEVYPYYEKVRLIRILPDSLFIDFVKRQPIAYIKLSRYFYIDEKLILWDISDQQAGQLQDGGIPVILGMDTKIANPKTGKTYAFIELRFAVEIIKEINAQQALKGCRISKIDIKNPSSISFFVVVNSSAPLPTTKAKGFLKCDDIEVKMSIGDSKEKISILTGLFSQLRNDLCKIKYIDLRFREPVINFNNA